MIFNFFRSHLQAKFVLTLTFVMLIPTVVTSAVSLNRAEVAIVETTRTNAMAAAKAKVSYAEDYFNRAMADALTLSQGRSLSGYVNSALRGEAERSALTTSLTNFMRVNPQYRSATVIDVDLNDAVRVENGPGGTSPVPADDLRSTVNPADFQLATDGMKRLYISSAALDPDPARGKALVLYYYMALYSTDNQLQGVFRLTLLLDPVLQVLADSGADTVYVSDQTGVFLVHPDPTHSMAGAGAARFTLAAEQPGLYNLANTNLMGQVDSSEAIETFLHLQPPRQAAINWTVVYRKPIAPIVTDIRSAQVTILAITILALTAALCLSILLTRNLIAPLRMLAVAANEITHGNMRARIPAAITQDEVGQLTDAFREMIGALNVSYTNLNRHMQELEVANVKANEAVRVKSEFLANISHELRTPLNAIIGFSDMLLSDMVGPLNDRQRHKLERLNENGARLLGLIDELLELSRMESGKIAIVEQPFNPRSLLERTGAQMESLAERASLPLLLEIPLDFPEMILGDERRIEQCLVNLLSNAFKFTSSGYVKVCVGAGLGDHTWWFSVQDTGIGIPTNAQQLIFEEFRQVDTGYSRMYKGTGLGLAITKRLVAAMDGSIHVESQVGHGSTFTIVLPLRVPEPAGQQPTVPASGTG